MSASAPAWAAAIEASVLGEAMRASGWIYPAANVLHLFGMALVVAPILLLDLRLLGAGRRHFPLRASARVLTGWAVAGVVLAASTGLALFAADAGALARNPVFLAKVALFALAVGNALAFRLRWHRELLRFDTRVPAAARAQLLASTVLWLAVPVAGRLIAYV